MSLFKDLLECQSSEVNKVEEYEESIVLENLNVENESEILSLYVCESCGALHESAEGACECGGKLAESMKLVVKAGKVVKKKVKSKKGKMSAKQKSALAKARKKAHSTGANKARAKSMKVRSKKIKEEVNESEEFECPVCDYVGSMNQNEEGYYVCPECGAELELAEVEEACGDKGCKTKGKKGYTNEGKVTLDPSLVKYVEALSIDKEIVSKGDQAVKAFLVKEYGIFL